jgi:hypothetical protein
MSELQATLEDLGLYEYQNRLVRHGFDTRDKLANIKETDMAALGIKLGHRRRLQRENARWLGHPAKEPLFDLPAAAPQAFEKSTSFFEFNHQYPCELAQDSSSSPVRSQWAYITDLFKDIMLT